MNVTAVILAGGVGKRFVPFAGDKSLFPFCGKPLVQHTLEMAAAAGIQAFVVATNSINHAWFVSYAEQHPELMFTLRQQPEPLGMANAVLHLADDLPERDILIMNSGDMVAPHLFPEFLKQAAGQEVLLTGMEVDSYQPLGYFALNGDRIVGIAEKPGADRMPSNLANLVFHYFAAPRRFLALLQSLPATDDSYEQALSLLMQEVTVGVYRYRGPWQKLKYGHFVLDMVEFFLTTIGDSVDSSAHIDPSTRIVGPVFIGPGARIGAHASIVGPAYIGAKVIIGNNALIRSSIIEEGAIVGFASEIARSYIGPHCDLHHVYVGDSILEDRVHFGYGSHTANYRHDHRPIVVKMPQSRLETERTKLGALIAKGVEVGVNVSFMPGVTVGESSTIAPASVVYEPVPAHSLFKTFHEQTIVPKKAV